MKTVAIICEYNPFHNGHAYHLERVRNEFGEDTAIIAIMSGNYTQRGELAIADAFTRAKAAVQAGIQLVLKIPFPFSISSSEYFASAGVSIADNLGVVDILSFGSESGDIIKLKKVASQMNSIEYQEKLSVTNLENIKNGHAKNSFLAYQNFFDKEDAKLLQYSNNLLAIEYLKTIEKNNMTLNPHTITRRGSSFLDSDLNADFPSAYAIRHHLLKTNKEELNLIHLKNTMPSSVFEVYQQALLANEFPVDSNRISQTFLFFLRNILPYSTTQFPQSEGGIYNRIFKKAQDSTTIEEVIQLSLTKKYTLARIRRSVIYAILGVTSSEISEKPAYTQVLAMDKQGQELLKQIKKKASIEILTKPADYKQLSSTARRQAEKDFYADEFFLFAKPVVEKGGSSYRRTPYLKTKN